MCLRTKWDSPKKASKDIPCWIVVDVANNCYFSYYLGAIIEDKMTSYLDRIHLPRVMEGLHSFAMLKDAILFKKHSTVTLESVKILKCIIPKGSLYYKGTFTSLEFYSAVSYASTKRNLFKPIKRKETLCA